MKAVVMERRNGGIESLRLRELPTPVPKRDQVLVRIHAASVNDWDWGLLQTTASRFERFLNRVITPDVTILGCDIAGRIEAVGRDVTAWRAGDEVYGDLSGHGFGAFAEYVSAPAASLARKPATMSFEQAAAIPQATMLAVQGLALGGIRSGQKVLLNGAGGGVGTFALQLARLHDVEITAVDKAGKLDLLRSLGAHHVLDYASRDFTQEGERYDLVLDVRTWRSPFVYARALKPGGAYVTVGGDLPRLLQAAACAPLIRVLRGKHVRVLALKPNQDLGDVGELFEAGTFAPVMEGPYPLADLAAAFRRFATGEHLGKIVVTMPA